MKIDLNNIVIGTSSIPGEIEISLSSLPSNVDVRSTPIVLSLSGSASTSCVREKLNKVGDLIPYGTEESTTSYLDIKSTIGYQTANLNSCPPGTYSVNVSYSVGDYESSKSSEITIP
jgi:hypothetical protein